jgi:hypothetical protein
MKELKIGKKIKVQLNKRGWTEESVRMVYLNPDKTSPTRDRRHNAEESSKYRLNLS